MSRANLTELEAQLLDALEDAKNHLEYCGWGDSWERECAHEAKLPEKVDAAIAAALAKRTRTELT